MKRPPAVERWLESNRRAFYEQQRQAANADALRGLGIIVLVGMYVLAKWLEHHS